MHATRPWWGHEHGLWLHGPCKRLPTCRHVLHHAPLHLHGIHRLVGHVVLLLLLQLVQLLLLLLLHACQAAC